MDLNPTVKDKPCIFCGVPGSTKGEHAIPRGAIRRLFPDSDGPYRLLRDGVEAKQNSHIGRPKVPCCDSNTNPDTGGCNRLLDERFEHPYMKVAVGFIQDADAELTVGEALSVDERLAAALWWIKTLMLLHHPETIDFFRGVDRPRAQRLIEAPTAWDWMVDTDTTPPAPTHVTLWATTSPSDDPLVEDHRLGQWTDPSSGRKIRQQVLQTGIKRLRFTLLYHPGGKVRLPTQPGAQLWPPVQEPLDWADLAVPAGSLHSLSASLNRLMLKPNHDPFTDRFDTPIADTEIPLGAIGCSVGPS